MYSLSISYRNSPEFHLNLLNAKVFCCFKDALKWRTKNCGMLFWANLNLIKAQMKFRKLRYLYSYYFLHVLVMVLSSKFITLI